MAAILMAIERRQEFPDFGMPKSGNSCSRSIAIKMAAIARLAAPGLA